MKSGPDTGRKRRGGSDGAVSVAIPRLDDGPEEGSTPELSKRKRSISSDATVELMRKTGATMAQARDASKKLQTLAAEFPKLHFEEVFRIFAKHTKQGAGTVDDIFGRTVEEIKRRYEALVNFRS
jgi:hypothetical protein